MKKVNNVSFDVLSLSGFGLNLTPEQSKSPEGIRKVIDDYNYANKLNDRKPEQFYIYKIVSSRSFDDNGIVIDDTTVKTKVETYPVTPDETPRYYVIAANKKTVIGNSEGVIESSYNVVKAVSACERNTGSYVVRATVVRFKNIEKSGEIVYRCSKQREEV